MSDACLLLAPLRLLFPFLTPFYGNDGTKFSKKAERRLSLSSSSPARRGNTKFFRELPAAVLGEVGEK
jgi:hypothetical protein